MNSGQFWNILQAAYAAADNGTVHDWFVTLKGELAKLPPSEILQFRRRFEDLVDAADKTDLWGAAYLRYRPCPSLGGEDGPHGRRVLPRVGQGGPPFPGARPGAGLGL